MTLYEILNGFIGDDMSYLTPAQKQDIESSIKDLVEKKIGAAEYQKLDSFVEQNKGDDRLEGLVGCLLAPLSRYVMSSPDEITYEKRKGSSVATSLHEVLTKNNYDLDQALLSL